MSDHELVIAHGKSIRKMHEWRACAEELVMVAKLFDTDDDELLCRAAHHGPSDRHHKRPCPIATRLREAIAKFVELDNEE